MAETALKTIEQYENSDTARTYRVLTATSATEIPSGEYIYFKAVFHLKDDTQIERTIKDANGQAVTLNAIDDMVVLDYNFIQIKPIYVGSSVPADLKVYEL